MKRRISWARAGDFGLGLISAIARAFSRALGLALALGVALALGAGLAGCSRIEYREVLLPTHCDSPERARPLGRGDSVALLREVLIYTETLESDLRYCRGESRAGEL